MTEMHTPRPTYYALVTTLTQFILAIAALLVLLPSGLLGRLPWGMIVFLLIYNVVIATLVAVTLTSYSQRNKPTVLRGGGLVLGHLVGIMLGGFIGMKYGGTLWAIIGAVVSYFLVGWVGSRISTAVAAYLDRRAAPAPRRDLQTALRFARPTASSLVLYSAIIPALLMGAAILLRGSDLTFAQYPAALPRARSVLVILSLLSILVPWVRRKRVLRRRSGNFINGSALRAIGLGLSLAPAIYGFLLFVWFDLSIAELSLFAVVASVAASTWAVSQARR